MGWINADLVQLETIGLTQDELDNIALIHKIRPVYGTMTITQHDINDTVPNQISVAAHPSGTDTMNPPSVPVLHTGQLEDQGLYRVEMYEPSLLKEGPFDAVNQRLLLPSSGAYEIPVGWGAFRHSANNATVAMYLGIIREVAGTEYLSFGPRPISVAQPNIGKIAMPSGGGTHDGVAGDILTVWIAADTTGTVTIGNGNVSLKMMEDLT